MYNNTFRIIVVVAFLIACVAASCCAIFYSQSRYNTVHVCDNYGNCFDYEIKSYKLDRFGGAYIKTKEYGSMYLSEGTYALFENDCPLCARFYHMPEKENDK